MAVPLFFEEVIRDNLDLGRPDRIQLLFGRRVTRVPPSCFRTGFSNAMLRERAGVLFDPGPRGYTAARMTYDLRRLRLKGIIERRPKRNRYLLTPMGRRIALFFAKAHSRIFRPGLARIDPAIPPDASDPLARLWRKLDAAIDQHVAEARMAA